MTSADRISHSIHSEVKMFCLDLLTGGKRTITQKQNIPSQSSLFVDKILYKCTFSGQKPLFNVLLIDIAYTLGLSLTHVTRRL